MIVKQFPLRYKDNKSISIAFSLSNVRTYKKNVTENRYIKFLNNSLKII